MAQRAASYGTAVLHKSLTMKHCFAKAPQYEASPFHSDMKHFAYAPYDVRKWKMRVTLSALYYDLQSSPLWLDFFMPRFYPQNRKQLQQINDPTENKQRTVKSPFFRCVLHRSSQNSLFGQVAGPFQEIISQPHREQHFTETHRKITENSLFFPIL